MNRAEIEARRVEQQSKIGRRPGIINERRNTRAPELRSAESMRTATRGDVGGAQALMAALNITQNIGGEIGSYIEGKHAEREKENITQGAFDQSIGAVDEERMAKSDGYRNAVTKGRTMTEFNAATREFDEQLRELIEGQDNPDLEVRRAEVLENMERFYQDFAQDPETGELKEFLGSPGAMRYLAESIQSSRPQFEQRAMTRIEERFNKEALSHLSNNLVDQALASGTFNLEEALSLVPGTVPDEAVRSTIVASIPNAVDALKEAGRFDEALGLYDAIIGQVPEQLTTNTPDAPVGIEQFDPGQSSAANSPAPTAPAAAPKPGGNGRVKFADLRDAVEFAESRGNPNAVSPVGAVGKMQTMPGTLRDPGYGVKPARDNSPEELTRVGNDYLKAMLREYDGDYVLALSAYNAGPGRANEWKALFAGKSLKEKIAAIPFKETRDYVGKILGRLGVVDGEKLEAGGAAQTPDDPVLSTPGFRLTKPSMDPVEAYEALGTPVPIAGLDKLNLSAEALGAMREQRDQLAVTIKREWNEKRREEQSFNASTMALGLFGQGRMPTSQDITEAIRSEAIDPQTGMTLFGLLRQNAGQAQAYNDRQEAKRDRAEAKAERDQSKAILGRYIGQLVRGEISGAEARSAVLKELPSISNPIVQTNVINGVMGIASDMEGLIQNSAPVRNAVKAMQSDGDNAAAAVATWGILGSRQAEVARAYESIIDDEMGSYLMEVRDGADPQEALKAAAAEVARRKALLRQQAKPAPTAAQ